MEKEFSDKGIFKLYLLRFKHVHKRRYFAQEESTFARIISLDSYRCFSNRNICDMAGIFFTQIIFNPLFILLFIQGFILFLPLLPFSLRRS